MNAFPSRAAFRAGLFALGVFIVTGCASSLLPKPAHEPTLFVLDDTTPSAADTTSAAPPKPGARTLIVDTPRAAAGFDSVHMVYQRRPNEREYFALNQWVDSPARMLAPLMVRAIQRTGAFRAVLDGSTSASADLRVSSEIVRLQQDFSVAPSRVRLTLRVVVVDSATRQVVATREFDATLPAASDDPRGGVDAANRLVAAVLAQVASFCIDAGSPPR
ncbi:MAG: ABC-type transport auxiliary lipoprotein family protein [Burkholderiaceae bacterium]